MQIYGVVGPSRLFYRFYPREGANRGVYRGPKVGETLVNVARITLFHSLLRPTVGSVVSSSCLRHNSRWGGVQRGIMTMQFRGYLARLPTISECGSHQLSRPTVAALLYSRQSRRMGLWRVLQIDRGGAESAFLQKFYPTSRSRMTRLPAPRLAKRV